MVTSQQIDDIKKRIDIVTLISEYVSLKKTGRNFRGICPFHQEKTPSFMVSSELQIFKCFGCNRGGDCFEFLKDAEGIEFGEALERLSKRAGIVLKETKKTPEQINREVAFDINAKAAEVYHHLLLKTSAGKKAKDYLEIRGVNEKSIKDFKLGYAPVQRDFVFRYLKKKGFNDKDLVTSGVVIKGFDGFRDRFFSRVMFPIIDLQDRVVGFSGRILGDGEPKYLNSSDSVTFNKSLTLFGINLSKTEIKKARKSVLVEGNLDVVSSHQAGVKNVVAPLGTALTSQQLLILKRFASEVVLAFDNDVAGDSAARRSIEIAENAGMDVRIAVLKAGKDPDECIKISPDLWKESIEEAVPVYDYLIISAQKRFDIKSAEGKRKFGSEILPMVARIEDQLMSSHYIQKVSSLLGVGEEVIREAIKKFKPSEAKFNVPKPEVSNTLPKMARRKMLEKYLLALMTSKEFKDVPLEVFKEVNYREIVSQIKLFEGKESDLQVLSEKLSPQAKEDLTDIFLLEVDQKILEDDEKFLKEVENCKRELYHLQLKDKLSSVSIEIKQAEANKESLKVSELTKEFKVLTDKLRSVEEK